MSVVASAVARQVATRTAPKSMPAALRTAGCTNTIYAIVRNVVTPASTSVRTVVPWADSANRCSRNAMAVGRLFSAERQQRLVLQHVEARDHADDGDEQCGRADADDVFADEQSPRNFERVAADAP